MSVNQVCNPQRCNHRHSCQPWRARELEHGTCPMGSSSLRASGSQAYGGPIGPPHRLAEVRGQARQALFKLLPGRAAKASLGTTFGPKLRGVERSPGSTTLLLVLRFCPWSSFNDREDKQSIQTYSSLHGSLSPLSCILESIGRRTKPPITWLPTSHLQVRGHQTTRRHLLQAARISDDGPSFGYVGALEAGSCTIDLTKTSRSSCKCSIYQQMPAPVYQRIGEMRPA